MAGDGFKWLWMAKMDRDGHGWFRWLWMAMDCQRLILKDMDGWGWQWMGMDSHGRMEFTIDGYGWEWIDMDRWIDKEGWIWLCIAKDGY